MTDISTDILVDAQFSPEQEALIVAALAELGISARVRVLPPRRSAHELQWLVLMALPLEAFLTSVGTRFGEDASRGFQNAVRKVLRREHATAIERPLVLQDATSGLRIVLDRDLPAEGYEQLLTLDLSQFHIGPVHYDRSERRWRSELDEADR